MSKLVGKEEEKKTQLEAKRKELNLEHQLAALRVGNKDIQRDIEESQFLAASLGVHDRDASFRPLDTATTSSKTSLFPCHAGRWANKMSSVVIRVLCLI